MSNLGNAFRSFLKHHPKMNQAELAKRMGVVPSYVTHLMKGRRRSLGLKTLESMVLNITPNSEIQAEILAAYLKDMCGLELQHLVEIAPSRMMGKVGTKSSEKDCYEALAGEFKKLALDEKIVDNLLVLGRAARKNAALAQVLQNLAKIA